MHGQQNIKKLLHLVGRQHVLRSRPTLVWNILATWNLTQAHISIFWHVALRYQK